MTYETLGWLGGLFASAFVSATVLPGNSEAALLAVLHFFWMRAGKHDFAEVAPYPAIIVALLGWRLWCRLKG